MFCSTLGPLKTFYLNVILSNLGTKTFEFKYPPATGENIRLTSGSVFYIHTQSQSVTVPDPIKIQVYEVGTTNEPRVIDLTMREDSSNQTISLSASDLQSSRQYYLNVIFKNVGTKNIQFKFPPTDGQLIELPIGGEAYLSSTRISMQMPDPIILEVIEGPGFSYQSKMTVTLYMSLSAENQTINLGQPGPIPTEHQPKTYYLNVIFKNIGTSTVQFTFPPVGGQLIELPSGAEAYLSSTQTFIQIPDPFQLEITQIAADTSISKITVTLYMSLSAENQTINLGQPGPIPTEHQPKTYYLNVIFKNVGTSTVQFTFPPVGGQLIVLPSGAEAYLSSTQNSIQIPDPFKLEITQIAADTSISKQIITLIMTGSAQNQTITLGESGGISGGKIY